MNTNFDIAYLEGADDYFGPDLGGATVYTNTRGGYAEECGNVGSLLENLSFTLEMENQLMGEIMDDGEDPRDAARAYLQANPEVLEAWLEGVETVSVTSGATVPEELVQGVLDFLAERGYPAARAVQTAEESLIFALPPELRRDLRAAGQGR